MACVCIDQVDAKLKADHDARLPVALNLSGGPHTIAIQTHLIEWPGKKKKRGARAPFISATFCPFCGVRYEAAP